MKLGKYVYAIRDRISKNLLYKPYSTIGSAKAQITFLVNSEFYLKNNKYDLVQFELVERKTIPLTNNNDFNKLMYETLEK